MKTTLTHLFLLLSVGACKSDSSIGPADWLYQRWHLDRTKQVSDTIWMMNNTDAYYDTEYRPDGTLIYRKDGVVTPTACCSGGRFSRKGSVIEYTDFPSCPSVRCSSGNVALINVLASDLLELQNGNTITQYRPVK